MEIAEAYVSQVLLTLETISPSYEILWLHVSVTYVTHKELWDLMWNIVWTGLLKWIGVRLKNEDLQNEKCYILYLGQKTFLM